jgi:hypothetical protein
LLRSINSIAVGDRIADRNPLHNWIQIGSSLKPVSQSWQPDALAVWFDATISANMVSLNLMRARYHSALLCALSAACMFAAGCRSVNHASAPNVGRQVEVLNQLRNEINLAYGYRNLAPRINLGPCGRFAKAFREQWNARFSDPINIVFVMSPDRTECYHVLVKLPDGNYYDGGNGVIAGPTLLCQYRTGTRLDEMVDYDLKRLEKWSYGFNRKYEQCPNYSDGATLRLISTHLDMLR